jgi:hypothetical protein
MKVGKVAKVESAHPFYRLFRLPFHGFEKSLSQYRPGFLVLSWLLADKCTFGLVPFGNARAQALAFAIWLTLFVQNHERAR